MNDNDFNRLIKIRVTVFLAHLRISWLIGLHLGLRDTWMNILTFQRLNTLLS